MCKAIDVSPSNISVNETDTNPYPQGAHILLSGSRHIIIKIYSTLNGDAMEKNREVHDNFKYPSQRSPH